VTENTNPPEGSLGPGFSVYRLSWKFATPKNQNISPELIA